jgi:hypothetical protein
MENKSSEQNRMGISCEGRPSPNLEGCSAKKEGGGDFHPSLPMCLHIAHKEHCTLNSVICKEKLDISVFTMWLEEDSV